MAEPHLRDEVLAQLKAQAESEAAKAEKTNEQTYCFIRTWL